MPMTTPSRSILFFFHGLHGAPEDWNTFIKIWKLQDISNTNIYHSIASYMGKTHDGILKLGDYAFKEVLDVLQQWKETRLNLFLIGHSLGGLILREVIKRLECETNLLTFHRPHSIVTIATPHLGTKSQKNPPREFGVPKVTAFLGETGEDLMWKNNVIKEMLTLPYLQGINRFEKFLILSNICHDLFVPYCTSSIKEKNPFMKEGITLKKERNYPSIVQVSEGEKSHDLLSALVSWRKRSKSLFYPQLEEEDKRDFSSLVKTFDEGVSAKVERIDVGILNPDAHSRIALKRGDHFDIVFYCIKVINE